MSTAISNFVNTVIPFAVVVQNIDPNCSYYQKLEFGYSYYIYNNEYPANYSGRVACQWIAVSPPNSKIVLSCEEVSLPKSLNCFQDRIEISSSENDLHKYCGEGKFTFVTQENTLSVVLRSTAWSKGGRFVCTITAIDDPEKKNETAFQKPTGDYHQCTCGWRNEKKIYGGHETKVNEYPAMAGLIDLYTRNVFCGATIISENYVLTAGHCVSNTNSSNIMVLVGDHDLYVGTDTSSTALYRALNIIIHPRYDPIHLHEDLALIKVFQIKFNENVGPACLPFRYSAQTFDGVEVSVLGWGQLEFSGPNSNTLQEADLKIITNFECQQNYPQEVITYSQICTFAPDMDSCTSDSGGPVFWQNKNNKKLYLIGVISSGLGCGIAPGKNSRVTAFLEWILQAAGGTDSFCII